uniref:Guanine nucleotide-binding protein subunit gamma n=1 Tax=Panagrellus redivivus TaxID=6233 RepID=A0A7E4VBI4_PANRE
MARGPDGQGSRKVQQLESQANEMARTLINTADRYVETRARIPTADRIHALEEDASQFEMVPTRARRNKTGCCVIL